MTTTTKTIQAVSAPRARQPAPPRAPLTAEEKKDKRLAREDLQERIDADVAEWFSYTNAKAVELGLKYDKKPRYFLDIFFQGGAHMVNHQEKTNPYNAFKAEKAAQRREEGQAGLKVQELHEEYKAEYDALTEEEKAELVTRYDSVKDDIPKIRRDTAKARVRDMSNTVRNIQMLFHGLSYRVGIEGFFCIVRNNTDFFMGPQWYFTSDALRQYMPLAVRRKWDTSDVGTRLEAFAVAGCDTMNLFRTNHQKIAFLKGDIRDRVLAGLVDITGKVDIRMDYIYYKECIVLKYGIIRIGWTCERFVNPSDLSSSLIVLTTLRDALRDGACKWIKLTPAERNGRREAWEADVAAGKVVRRSRATCSDINKKRKVIDEDADESDPSQEMNGEPTENSPIVEEPTEGSTPSADAPPPRKRRKTAPRATASKTAVKPRASKAVTVPRTQGARQRAADANKENEGGGSGGKGPRDDEVTRGARARLHRHKSRAIISDAEDDDEAVGGPGDDAAGTAASAHDIQMLCIDPSLINLSA
ncbi:hypothetical protein C8R45DRAFT_1109541 [Mycena sanguinolenta]|nr:hypothetical protein C8R45DRAFT_1109541 [Mycena sanguinolenta]